MVSQRLKKHANELVYLQKARPCIRKHLITKADRSLVDCLCECADNILRGNVPLTKPQKEKLARNKAGLRALTKNRSLSKEESDLTERWIFGIPTRRRFPRRQVVVYGIDHQTIQTLERITSTT